MSKQGLLSAVNQHDFKEDLHNLKNAITSTQMGTLVVLGKDAAFELGKPDTHGPFSRIWWVRAERTLARKQGFKVCVGGAGSLACRCWSGQVWAPWLDTA